MTPSPTRALLLLLAIVAGSGRIASAHLVPREQGILRILDSSVCLDATVSLSAATAGAVERAADSTVLPSAAPGILSHLRQRIEILDAGMPGTTTYESVSMAGPAAVRLTRCMAWDRKIEDLSVRASIFQDAPRATLALQATRDRQVEAIVFTSRQTLHKPFRGPWELLADFAVVGIAHILSGFDHLLFLLTIVVAGTGWRHWAKVVTSFTVAHSITLVLATMGRFDDLSAVVEPAIAASIVVVAMDNFRRPGNCRHQVAVVFACGLLHGMGFAGAIAGFGLAGTGLAASLAGFNLGVEAGQAAFLLVMLAIGSLLTRWEPIRANPLRASRAVSLAAAFAGTGLFLQRILSP